MLMNKCSSILSTPVLLTNVLRFTPSTAGLIQNRKISPIKVHNHVQTCCRRFLSSATRNDTSCELLTHRQLVRISGVDTFNFLHGLVTNDVRILENSDVGMAQYAMMLNVQGRVLYDLILYKPAPTSELTPSVLLECDSTVLSDLINVLNRYRLRKKVTITSVDDWSVWAAFRDPSLPEVGQLELVNSEAVLISSPDPRIGSFGYRLLLPRNIAGENVIKNCQNVSGLYTQHRYKIGLSEGAVDLPPAHCLPLESNLEFLNGVSFSKGCYVGQELTARTYHTGVIRKRLMPLLLSKEDIKITSDSVIENSQGKGRPCGKVRNFVGRYGLGLLRIDEVIGKGPLVIKIGDDKIADAETFFPSWWPKESDEIVKQTIAKDKE